MPSLFLSGFQLVWDSYHKKHSGMTAVGISQWGRREGWASWGVFVAYNSLAVFGTVKVGGCLAGSFVIVMVSVMTVYLITLS